MHKIINKPNVHSSRHHFWIQRGNQANDEPSLHCCRPASADAVKIKGILDVLIKADRHTSVFIIRSSDSSLASFPRWNQNGGRNCDVEF